MNMKNFITFEGGECSGKTTIINETIKEFEKDFAEVREDIAELSATTKELVQFSGWVVETINEFSAATEEHINRIDATVAEFSAATVAEVTRLDGKVDELSATTKAFSAATVAEIELLDNRIDEEAQARIDNDLTPGVYVLSGEPSSEMVIPTNSDEIADIKIKVSDDFFNFGEF